MLKKLKLNTKGDTIVEVLISVAVLSLVLSVSYALANRNTQYIQQSQERGEAQEISEAQLELLRGYLKTHGDWPGYTCFNTSKSPTSIPAQCQQGIDSRYRIAISESASAPDTYTVTTTWPSLTSDTDQSVELSYKLPATALETEDALVCVDGLDNDGDGFTDSSDPGCSGPNDGDEWNPPPACSNGADDDFDGLTDGSDPGCTGPLDNDEYNVPPACSNGADDDFDGLTDGSDPGCSGSSDNDEYNPPSCGKAICF
ncbi:MAG TPA: hypothetical protein VFX86_03845 [Candidatus Saccharimonadales bacterium]|nr:hypothetical protein [Candidatus Saccharimonadales bacterium]